MTGPGLASFDWSVGVLCPDGFLKGKNERHTTPERRDEATAAAARFHLVSSAPQELNVVEKHKHYLNAAETGGT